MGNVSRIVKLVYRTSFKSQGLAMRSALKTDAQPGELKGCVHGLWTMTVKRSERLPPEPLGLVFWGASLRHGLRV